MEGLKINFCGRVFENPFVLPSGIITEIPDHVRAVNAGAGAITFKSLTLEPRAGNPLPQICKYDHGFLNSVGIKNPGIEIGIVEISRFIAANSGVPAIVSLFAPTPEEFAQLVEMAVTAGPDFIELNLSCPNVKNEFGAPVAENQKAVAAIVAAAKKVSGAVPVLAKLSPNVTDIAAVAHACEAAGADGIVAINTVGPGMVIDIDKRKPFLGALSGGVSGPGIFPVAVRCVYDIYEAVKIPIIGMGGISGWRDTVEIMMAGATLVGVGSVTYSKGMKVFAELKDGISGYMCANSITDLRELVGVAHHK